MEDVKFKTASLNWLYEMEALDSAAVQANFKENILLCHPDISDCQVLIFMDRKDLLVYIEVGFWGRLFKRDKLAVEKVTEVLNKLLPSFRKRVVTSKTLYDLALERVNQYYGGRSEKATDDSKSVSDQSKSDSQGSSDRMSTTSNLLPDSKKPTEDQQDVCLGTERRDPQGSGEA